ncbi:nitrilase-related carbon-nitrogen hydrolase [Brevibacterium renqingii]|uniref:nitrilase-related carbon-nitrogen hydrolase n=1 Tax=Brevibacterium renqingii TaxID=2776916 RepID=UPI001ADEC5C0|nr:nitrilase-related carbon-nitrogen hydrolase [Brevibacterium renqingii]
MTKIACCQYAPVFGDVRSNVAESLALFHRAVDGGARVVVFPELASSGYAFADSVEADAAAETADGLAVSSWRQAADERGAIVVAGFCEANEHGAPYNSAAVLVPGRAPVIYRKAHLWDAERTVFTAGEAAPPVIETEHGRISVVICYDLEFPEWIRNPALRGADLICAPVNWPRMPRPAGERPGEVVRTQAQAAMNRVSIAACDRTGVERGIDWTSASVIVDANGWPLDMADLDQSRTETITADVDLSESRNKKLSAYSDVFADRRTDLYSAMRSDAHGTSESAMSEDPQR